jgi:hypothetical protein
MAYRNRRAKAMVRPFGAVVLLQPDGRGPGVAGNGLGRSRNRPRRRSERMKGRARA